MNKLFALTIICMVFLIGTVSAFEWDNGLRYENDDLKVTIENGYFFGIGEWFGFNEDLGSAELKSHSSVDEVLKFGFGSEEVVMYYDFDFLELYENGLGEVYFTDERNGKEIEKDYSFVYWTNETYEIDVYESQCSTSGNGTKICRGVLIGKENSTRKVWKDYNSRDIIKGKIRIGLKTYVGREDFIDGVWTIGGKTVKKHAVWTADLNVGLNHYYNLDGINDSLFTQNLTIDGSITFDAGLIGDNANGGANNPGNFLKTSTSWGVDGGAIGISVWVNATDSPDSTNDGIMGTQNSSSKVSYEITYSSAGGGEIKFIRIRNGIGGETLTHPVTLPINGSYQHIVASYDGAVMFLYFNGVLIDSTTSTGNGSALATTLSLIMADVQLTTRVFNGKVDELGIWGRNLTGAEVTQLFNSGAGITFRNFLTPIVTLNSPVDFLNSSSASITFNATISVNIPDNVTYFLDDIGNETNTTGILDDYIFTKEIAEGVHTWNVQACNFDGCTNGTARTFTVDNSAPIIDITFPTETINFHEVNTNLSVNWTVSDLLLDTCILQFEGVNRTVTCNDNQTEINITNSINRTIIFYANDTFGKMNSSSRTWNYLVFQHELFFNTSAFETSTQTFTINISANSTPSIASLIYSGTIFSSAIVTANSGFFNISRSINIPTSIGVKSFRFNFTVNSTEINTNSKNQTVNTINLTLCGVAPQNVPYINLTFKNETVNQESLNATIISTWIYSLSSVGDVNKTLSFSNASENILYSFCFNPSNRTINIDSTINYNNGQSQQRIFSLVTTLTNLTLSQVLYLLPTTLGLFSPFQVVDNIGNPLSNVRGLITRILGVSTITISSAFTDDSGFVSYFLNPEVTYIGSFSKTGFTTETFSFTPTADTRTVILGGGTGVIANGTSILTNTTYTITPANRTLTNGTDYLFSFDVSSSQAITFISMNITSNGTSHLFVSNAGDGLISGIVNTGENRSFVGYFVMKTSEETFSLASIWIIDQTFIGDYSLFKQMVLFNEYEFSDFIRLLITLVFIIGMMIFVNNIGISDDSESKIAIALLLVWAFSIVGWLDTGIIFSSTNTNIQTLAQFSNQFGIAILSTGAGTYFILRRIFT